MLGCLTVPDAQAWAQQTRWYFAEGATGPAFEQDLILANPTSSTAQVRITFLRGAQDPHVVTLDLPATTRRSIRVNTIPGLEVDHEISTVVESLNGVPIAAERTMYWGGAAKRGGHNTIGIDAPQTDWYLAEGATGSFFTTYILLANPNPDPATVTVRFLKDDGGVVVQTYAVAANRRHTVWVNTVAGMESANFGTVVNASHPVLVERAMYWSAFEGGHDAAAVPTPATIWQFAEGFTGSDFQTFLLLSNPNSSTSALQVTFYLETGTTFTRTYNLPGSSRLNVYVNQIPEMVNASFATTVTSSLPIVAERAMYWAGFAEGHATPGITQARAKWAFTEGRVGVHEGVPFDTFYLLLNSTPAPLNVRGTFYLEDGTGSVLDFVVPANSRYTLHGSFPPRMTGQAPAAFFEANAPFIAERATYWGAGWYGGHASIAIPWSGPIVTPPLLPRAAAPVFSTPPGTYNTEFFVSLETATPGATIRYTTDGTEPTAASIAYGGGIPVEESTTIKAKAFANQHTPSYTATSVYTLKAAPPEFQHPAGEYPAPIEFGISTSLAGSQIHFTTDGSEPTEYSPMYAAPIQAGFEQVLTLKARVFRSGWTPSVTATAVYHVTQGVLQTPVSSPTSGVYSEGQVVTLTAQPGVDIRYTTDGSDPHAGSPQYVEAILLLEPLTIKARAFHAGFSPSAVLAARYDLKVETPELSPGDSILTDSGTYVLVTAQTQSSTMRYTLDRNDPTEESSITFGNVWASVGDTLKVRAFRSGWVPSDVVSGTYTSATLPESPGEFTVLGVEVTGFNRLSSSLMFRLDGASLNESSVLVLRNGSEATAAAMVTGATPNDPAASSVTLPTLLDGRNELEIYATDTNLLEVYAHTVVWSGNRTATIRVETPSGGVLSGAHVRAILLADESISAAGVTGSGGTASVQYLPTLESFRVEVSADGYRSAVGMLGAGATGLTVRLARDNLKFRFGAQGWTGAVEAMAHSETSDPLEYCTVCPIGHFCPLAAEAERPVLDVQSAVAPCWPNCDQRQLLRTAPGSSSNTDILLRTGTQASRRATHRFHVTPGTQLVRVRYRVQTAEVLPHPPYQHTLPWPDRYAVSLRSTATSRTVSDSRTIAQLYQAGLFDGNQATPWLELAFTLAEGDDEIELELEVENACEDVGWETGVWVDVVEEEVYEVSALELHDYKDTTHDHRDAVTPERIQHLSADEHGYYAGNTRVNGTIVIRAPEGARVSAVTLEILEGSVVRAQAPLVDALEPTLLRTIGPEGVISVPTSQLMFEIASAQFASLTLENEVTLSARVRVQFANGRVITRSLGRGLKALAMFRGSGRYGSRDPVNCAGLPNGRRFPCGGDEWAHPLTVRFAQGVAGVTWNDFSNMNGGRFPIHASHRTGVDIDGRFSGYQNRDEATARTMLAFLNQYGRRIERVFVTYRRTASDPFFRAIENVVLNDGRRAQEVIEPVDNHADHFHWRLNASRLP